MADEVQIPSNAPPAFVSQIKQVLEKAKANGDSLLGFDSFVSSYWNQYKATDPMAGGDQWELKDVDGDGVMEWVNKATQEIKETGYGSNENDSLMAIENQMSYEDTSFDESLYQPDLNTDQMQDQGFSDDNGRMSLDQTPTEESSQSMLGDLQEFDKARALNPSLNYDQWRRDQSGESAKDYNWLKLIAPPPLLPFISEMGKKREESFNPEKQAKLSGSVDLNNSLSTPDLYLTKPQTSNLNKNKF